MAERLDRKKRIYKTGLVEKGKLVEADLPEIRDHQQKPAGNELQEARLAELVERREMSHAFIDRLAVYLDCEPWQALAYLEDRPETMHQIVALHSKQKRENYEIEKLQSNLEAVLLRLRQAIEIHDAVEEVYIQKESTALSPTGDHLKDVERFRPWEKPEESFHISPLERSSTDPDLSKSKQYGIAMEQFFSGGNPIAGVQQPWNPPQKNSLKSPILARRDFWTMVRIIGEIDNHGFGFNNSYGRIDSIVEDIGRVFDPGLKRIDNAYYTGNKTPVQEKLRNLDVRDAEAIVARFKIEQAKLQQQQEERSKQWEKERHDNLLRLSAINEQLSSNLTIVRKQRGLLPWVVRQINSRIKAVYQQENERIKKLMDERDNILLRLESRVDLRSIIQALRNGKADVSQRQQYEKKLSEWSEKAEAEADREVDEILANEGI